MRERQEQSLPSPRPRLPLAAARLQSEPSGVRFPDISDLFEASYRVTFARDEADLERVQRLRFEVFNRELGEGLAGSWTSGLDRDPFDASCHHLMIVAERTGEVVGTYRLQTASMARAARGFYCAQEFELAGIEPVLGQGVELGRACILREHRHGSALFALWRGIAAYLAWSRKRYLFGCSSLTSQDPRDGLGFLAELERGGHVHDSLRASVLASHACLAPAGGRLPRVKTPALFGTYLRYGAKVCSGPALDREFGTIDFLIVLDLASIPPRLRRFFFAGLDDPLEGPPS